MANYIATDTDLEVVANAIRSKGGTSAQLVFPAGFANAIDAIDTSGGGSTPTLVTKTITANGTYAASSDNADGYSSVTVDVAGAPPENISVLFKNHNESSGTVAIGAEMYNATYGVILGQAVTSVSIGNTTTKTAAKQGNYIVATVNVVLNSVYYNGNQIPASFTGGGTTRFAIIELPNNYDNTIPIELKR